MERLTQTTIKALQLGDRFHLTSDKKKKVFEKVELTDGVKPSLNHCYAKADKDPFPVPYKNDTAVTFLRHKQQQTNEQSSN